MLTPTYDVEIKRPFAMPDFVAMDLGPDRVGMTQLFAGELQRAGFKVTSWPKPKNSWRLRPNRPGTLTQQSSCTKCWTTSARLTPARCP